MCYNLLEKLEKMFLQRGNMEKTGKKIGKALLLILVILLCVLLAGCNFIFLSILDAEGVIDLVSIVKFIICFFIVLVIAFVVFGIVRIMSYYFPVVAILITIGAIIGTILLIRYLWSIL